MLCGGLLVRSTLFARPDSVTIAYPRFAARLYMLATDRGSLHFQTMVQGKLVHDPCPFDADGPDIVTHFNPHLSIERPLSSPSMPPFLYSYRPFGRMESTTAGFAFVSRWHFVSLPGYAIHTWTIAVPLWLPMLLFLFPPLRWLRRRLRATRNRRGFEPLPAAPLHAALQVNK